MIEFATASREFRSLIGRRRELQTLLGSVFAGLGIFLQNTLQGGLPDSLGSIKRHLFAFYAVLLMVPSLILALRMARLHGGLVLNGILIAQLTQGRELHPPVERREVGEAQLLRGLVPPVRPDGHHRRVLDAILALALHARMGLRPAGGRVDHGRLDGPLLPVPPPGRPIRPQEGQGRALRRLRPRRLGGPRLGEPRGRERRAERRRRVRRPDRLLGLRDLVGPGARSRRARPTSPPP